MPGAFEQNELNENKKRLIVDIRQSRLTRSLDTGFAGSSPMEVAECGAAWMLLEDTGALFNSSFDECFFESLWLFFDLLIKLNHKQNKKLLLNFDY